MIRKPLTTAEQRKQALIAAFYELRVVGPEWPLPDVALFAKRPAIVAAPPAPIKRQNATLTYKGRTRTVAEWAKLRGMPFTTLYNRLNDKRRPVPWSVEKALNTPVKPHRDAVRATK